MTTLADRLARHIFADDLISTTNTPQGATPMSSVYDDPDLKTGAFVTWETVGEELIGDVIDVEKGKDFNNNACPQLVIRTDDGEDRTLTCGQANLKHQILELRPDKGDRIRIKFVSTTKVEKGVRKDFTVEVTSGGAKGTAANVTLTGDPETDPF